jgi:hypothetical protein
VSPDIHWRVGEDAAEETVALAAPARRSRRSQLAVLIVVALGVSLGMAYRSIPEPASRPAPTPTVPPTSTRPAVPAALYQTIDREAQALADGDFEAYLDQQAAAAELDVQRQNFAAWGRPQDNRPLYSLVDFDLLTAASAWADIRQFRAGRYFRETRVYHRTSDRWLRSWPSNLPLWNGQEESLQTPHFDVTYAVEDREVISLTLRQLEADYQALCRDLGCALIGHELTFTVKITGDEGPYAYPVRAGEREIRLPSPRVTGFFESGRAYSWHNNFAHSVLLEAIVEQVYGGLGFERPGGGILWAGSIWALDRLDPLPAEFQSLLGDLKHKPLLSLETLWELSRVAEPGLALAQLYQLVRFVEQEYSAPAVTQLLHAIDSAKSLPEALDQSLGVSFAEFDQEWQTWAKQNIPSQ